MMNRIYTIAVVVIASVVIYCGCSYQEYSESVTEPVASESAESITVTFAQTEPSETSVPETSQTEVTTVLNDNQIEYRDESIAVLIEFTGAESLIYYPHALAKQEYQENDYVLHSVFTVENLSENSFDFIPQKMIIRGRYKKSRWDMLPVTANDTGLITSDSYYSVEAGESVSFEIDFVGKEDCIKHADEIVYAPFLVHTRNNVSHNDLNNVELAEGLHLTNRTAIKKAAVNALEMTESKPLPYHFTMSDGDYQLNTEKNSYCFNVDKLRPDGFVCDYIKVSLKVASITGEPEVFEPNMFKLVTSDDKYRGVSHWNFDQALVSKPKVYDEITINGVPVTLYEYPFDLYLRPDGTAEYDMYFFCEEGKEYVKFIYDGANDKFEKEIEIK